MQAMFPTEPTNYNSPLCIASAQGLIESCRTTISLGADLDFEGHAFESALMLACAKRQFAVVKLLVRADTAGIEAQIIGRTPALCADGSDFMVSVQECGNCIETFAASPNGTTGSDTVPALQPYTDYCDSIGNGTQVDIDALLSSWSSLQATQSAIQLSLSSLGYNVSTTMTTTGTTMSDSTTATTAADPAADSQNTSVGDASSSPDVTVIVPAVVVPGVVVSILILFAGWLLVVRRRKRRQDTEKLSGQAIGFDGKAQLHADPFRPELEGESEARKQLASELQEASMVAELPARELVGAEMPSDTSGTNDR
ncbi:hypothetical protein BJY00DRAFT_315990 [Aspergillus carlsbadensis]|nr:hypothetical protein BJY00DRAFT_315990 [Aspergillus carlsbadensis]